MDQHNSFRESIEAGDVVIGARTRSFSPALVEIYGSLGFDFVWLDFEHAGKSPWDVPQFEHLTRAAEVGDTELLVRLPNAEPSLIRRVLDAGVRNLLVPRIDTAEEVRQAVESTRFAYAGAPGERGTAGGRSNNYGTGENYHEREDRSVCLGVMIEKATAVENLSEILDVPELGFAFVGPGDLSVQLGYPGERDHPKVQQTIREIETTIVNSSVPLAGIAHDPHLAHEKTERGYQVIRLGGDFEATRQALGNRLSELEELRSE